MERGLRLVFHEPRISASPACRPIGGSTHSVLQPEEARSGSRSLRVLVVIYLCDTHVRLLRQRIPGIDPYG